MARIGFSIPIEAPIEKPVQPRADLFLRFGDGRGISYDEGCHNTIILGSTGSGKTSSAMWNVGLLSCPHAKHLK